MQYEFLSNFVRRMKNVGQHLKIISGSGGKQIWKDYSFDTEDSQLCIVYAVMLFIMEQDLKDEPCIMDDIAAFIEDINSAYFRKQMGTDDYIRLGDFIVNDVLSNEGRPMYFKAYDFDLSKEVPIHICYIANKSIYTDKGVRRTSYYMTEDGMSLLFSMLEFEDNLKLPVKEFVFRMHLEKQSYEKAVDEIKDIFVLLRMQVQKTRESIERIRRNVLEYNAAEYRDLKEETLDTIDETRRKFEAHRETVNARIKEIEQGHINLASLDDAEKKNLKNLQTIGEYLDRALSEYERVYSGYFDLSQVYTEELEKIREVSMVRRFNYRTDLFDKLLKKPEAIKNVSLFLQPLLNRDPDSILNMAVFLEKQVQRKEESSDGYELEAPYDEEAFFASIKEMHRIRMMKVRICTETILSHVISEGQATFSEICRRECEKDHYHNLIPDINIFKSIFLELTQHGEFNIGKMREELKATIGDEEDDRLGATMVDIIDSHAGWGDVNILTVEKINDVPPVVMDDIEVGEGILKRIRMTDMKFTVYTTQDKG